MKYSAGFFFFLFSLFVSLPQPITVGEDWQIVQAIPEEELIQYRNSNSSGVLLETDDVITEVHQFIPYDIPLEYNLQQFIFQSCIEKNINPELVFAIIERESTYNPDLIGDNGNSIGLMQIQPRWHSDRMERLSCVDLLNPYENIAVGIDILSELFDKYTDENYVLMCYNGGESFAQKQWAKGIYTTQYTRDVQEKRIAIHGKQHNYDKETSAGN